MFGLPHSLLSVLRIKDVHNVGIFSVYSAAYKKWVAKCIWNRHLSYLFPRMFSDSIEFYHMLVKEKALFSGWSWPRYSCNYLKCRGHIVLGCL